MGAFFLFKINLLDKQGRTGMSVKVIILAAGKGSRMRSKLPKVLQPLAAKPLLGYVIDVAQSLAAQNISTVVGHGAELVKKKFADVKGLSFVQQTEQLGTGHAVMQANDCYADEDIVLILYGDVPLTQTKTLQDLLSLVSNEHPLAVLTITLADSSGYGRIVRNSHHQVCSIVEEKDASIEQKKIKEVNTGIMAVKGANLRSWLQQLSCKNAQGEYYLTDIIAMCVAEGLQVATTEPIDEIEVIGVNNKKQLQLLERDYQQMLAADLMEQGATLVDASRIDIRGEVTTGMDVLIDVNTIFEGKVSLADDVVIGSHCIIKNTQIAAGTIVSPFSHIEGATIGENCLIGPYARIRPDSNLSDNVKIGNFVETKKVNVGKGSKVNHLSYIGDTKMGENCNIGAGTITCNYDGVNKHLTQLGNNVFIGSATQLVAPVSLTDNVTIGAGSTITKNVTEPGLALSRAKQICIKNWQKPVKNS